MRIHISDGIKKQELEALIAKGAKFVSYQYIISVPIFFPIKRFSKLYFIPPNTKPSSYSFQYNLFSVILGLWGLPMGPPFIIKTLMLNLRGGIDFTEDVLANLKDDTLDRKEIYLEKPSRYFLEPSKSNQKEFEKVFRSVNKHMLVNEPIVVGYFINTVNDEKPYYVIGVSSQVNDDIQGIIKNELYKRFYKHTRFDIVSLLDYKYEHCERLLKEGKRIDIR